MTGRIRSRLAGLKLPQHTLASMLSVSQTKLILILNGHRPPPAGFEAAAALDTLKRAERAAGQGAREGAERRGVSGERERYAAGWLAWRHDQNLVGVIRAVVRNRSRYDAGLLEDRSPYVVIERSEG